MKNIHLQYFGVPFVALMYSLFPLLIYIFTVGGSPAVQFKKKLSI